MNIYKKLLFHTYVEYSKMLNLLVGGGWNLRLVVHKKNFLRLKIIHLGKSEGQHFLLQLQKNKLH